MQVCPVCSDVLNIVNHTVENEMDEPSRAVHNEFLTKNVNLIKMQLRLKIHSRPSLPSRRA